MPIEDLDTYTEVDASSRLTVYPTYATGGEVDTDIDCYLYKNFGADNFDELTLAFSSWYEIGGVGDLGGRAGVGYSNTINTYHDWADTDVCVVLQGVTILGTGYCFSRLVRGNYTDYDGEPGDGNQMDADTTYYWSMIRLAGGDTVVANCYTDATYSTLHHSRSLTGLAGEKWQYFFPFVNYNAGTSGQNWWGRYEFLNLTGAAGAWVPKTSIY